MASGNRFEVSTLVSGLSLGASVTTAEFEIGLFDRINAIYTVTGASSLNGVLTPQFSIDGSVWINSATTFTITADESKALVHSPVSYKFIRFDWVRTAGTGNITIKIGSINENH